MCIRDRNSRNYRRRIEVISEIIYHKAEYTAGKGPEVNRIQHVDQISSRAGLDSVFQKDRNVTSYQTVMTAQMNNQNVFH